MTSSHPCPSGMHHRQPRVDGGDGAPGLANCMFNEIH
jgi:hypothetical protein